MKNINFRTESGFSADITIVTAHSVVIRLDKTFIDPNRIKINIVKPNFVELKNEVERLLLSIYVYEGMNAEVSDFNKKVEYVLDKVNLSEYEDDSILTNGSLNFISVFFEKEDSTYHLFTN